MPSLKENDILAILDTGAYGFSMSSQYTLRPRPPEAAIIKGKDVLMRKREEFKDIIQNQYYKKDRHSL